MEPAPTVAAVGFRRPTQRTPGGYQVAKMNHKQGWKWVIGLGFLLSFAGAFADDHGNTPEIATPIEIGVAISGVHDPAGDTDFFTFLSQADRYYRIETFDLQPQGVSDTVMVLYDTDKQTILAEDDQSGSELNASKILWASPRADRFYIEVFQFFTTATGSYKLIVEDLGEVPPDDHGDLPDATATALVVGASPTPGRIEPAGDVDFFSFAAQGGLFYDMETFDLGSGSDTVLTLFSPDGQHIIAQDDQSGRQLFASRIVWKAPETNVYYLRVSQYLPTGIGGYSVGVRNRGPGASLPTDGTPIAGLLSAAGEIRIYNFETQRRSIYKVDLTTGNILNRFTVTVLDSDGLTRLAVNSFSQSPLHWQAPSEGIYYLVIREDFEGGDFDLSILNLGVPLPNADLNEDYRVDHEDLFLLMQQWQMVYPTPTP